MFGKQISLKEALAMVPGQSKKRLDELVEKYHLYVNGTGKNAVYIKQTLHLAINVQYIKDLYSRHGQDWLKEYDKINSNGYSNDLIYGLTCEDIMRNKFTGLIIPTDEFNIEPSNPRESKPKEKDFTRPLMPIQPKLVKNIGIIIYCTLCRKGISRSSSNHSCKHLPENHCYRLRYTPPKSIPRISVVKNLVSRTPEDAIYETRMFKIEYQRKKEGVIIDSKPALLIDTIKLYEEYVNNKDNQHNLKTNGKGHKTDIIRNLRFMKEALEYKGYPINRILTTEFTREMAEKVSVYFATIRGLKGSHFRAVGQLSSFFLWAIEMKGYNMRNPFFKIKRYKEKPNPIAIEESALKSVIIGLEKYSDYCMNPEKPGIQESDISWLKRSILLCAFTGRRNEELVEMKWSNITEDRNGTLILRNDNLKIVRQKSTITHTEDRKYSIPLFPQFREFLTELGLEDKLGMDEYILLPEHLSIDIPISREYMSEKMSKAFTFIFKLYCKNVSKLTFKATRKLFTSKAKNAFGDRANFLTDHVSGSTLDLHYVDKTEFFATVAKEFSVFTEEFMLSVVLPSVKEKILVV